MTMQPSGFNNSTSKKDQYILVVDGKPAGPFSIEELRSRKLRSGDFVKTAAMDDYKEAHEIPELRELFGFAKRALPLQYFGSFDQRAIASVVDWLIVSFGFVFVAIGAVILITDPTTRTVVAVGMVALIPVAKMVYHITMESSDKQATYGKQLVNVRVTDIYGQRIDVPKAFARNFAKILSTITLCIGYLMCFFTKKQQCLHDMIAETLVIKDRL
ncbi:RDD family protein [Mucilaginibacter glaciei]|uniref:RDD family protein n=1 Tax=Mucilaginibacter glaciei TaxID=2772109 RepID=A0A926NPM1_9SPHI|nr:RDD family protein [Mucilaginibacter glaciei]MBD1392747.1 RDD family protein [Mucilaginibacter glaciei]